MNLNFSYFMNIFILGDDIIISFSTPSYMDRLFNGVGHMILS
ncbi:hypothetical protein HMPREF3222_00939 [Clostridium perfringens]|uniref:Uncharacterized protein n=1 Tax=Clostridium perfringens TaxID=1502 RepID=A0A133NAF3_CLOPF|nr:hypothetical protein HMPREF3222_00939 [Clostridium perfringens]